MEPIDEPTRETSIDKHPCEHAFLDIILLSGLVILSFKTGAPDWYFYMLLTLFTILGVYTIKILSVLTRKIIAEIHNAFNDNGGVEQDSEDTDTDTER